MTGAIAILKPHWANAARSPHPVIHACSLIKLPTAPWEWLSSPLVSMALDSAFFFQHLPWLIPKSILKRVLKNIHFLVADQLSLLGTFP